ncbi:unnamed protein product [Nippostrongylus brasiliensis]|uniref:Regulatory protein zeste n=1 Tax=Nippostrongylus brasiliensis TaxID=27835 RepID=A0A0N4YA11_NIPBR|nr:unnamed protein product [Nippostrongylus brasiliensis]
MADERKPAGADISDQLPKDDLNGQKMTEDHTVVICEEVLKRREILLDMCNTRETEINRKRAEAWDEVHMATMNRCHRNLRLEQIKRVWRHQKNRVRHILNLERQGTEGDVTLDDVIAARRGFMTEYEIAIARAYLEVPPRCRSPGSRRLDELDLTFRRRAAASPSIRIDDSVTSKPDGGVLDIQRLLHATRPSSSTRENAMTSKNEHAQRIAFEEQAQMYRSMRSFIEESTRTIRDLCQRIVGDHSSGLDSSPSESNLEFSSNNLA